MRSPLTAIAVFAIILAVLGLTLTRQDWLEQGASALALATAAIGLGIALGLGGEYVLGISVIFAAGAYTSAVLTVAFHWSYWPAALVGMLAATVVGTVMSLPGLRVSHFYFGMLGFFLVYLVPSLVQIFSPWTQGSNGLSVLDQPVLFGITLTGGGMFLLAGAGLVVSLLLSRNVRSSPLGVHMRRMRDSPVVLAASGVSVWRIRLATYVLSSVLAGLGGAVYGHISGFVQPGEFTFDTTNLILAAVIVGGSRTLIGPCIGVIILYVVPNIVLNVQGYSDIIYGVIIIVSVIAFRGGVVQAVRDLVKWINRRRGRRKLGSAPAEDVAALTIARSPDELADLLWSLRTGTVEDRTLKVLGARKQYGAVRALDFEDDESVVARSAEVHLLLGPNGSGKTTLLNAMCGLVHADAGKVTFDGSNITRTAVAKIARSGISRSFQSPALPDEVTPIDLFSAAVSQLERVSYFHWLLSDPVARRTKRESRQFAEKVASAAGLEPVANQECEKLTSGQRRIVDVVLSLISRSTIALLDEPAAGLSDAERRQLAATIRALASRGLGFIVVEHDLELALSLADTVTVMAAGRPVAQGTPDEIQRSAIVREVLIGAE